MSARDPILWDNSPSRKEKEIDNFLLFKQRAKEEIVKLSTAANFFKKILTFQTICANKLRCFLKLSLDCVT